VDFENFEFKKDLYPGSGLCLTYRDGSRGTSNNCVGEQNNYLLRLN